MKTLFVFSALSLALLFTGCETTTVSHGHHGYVSGGYYEESPHYVAYRDDRYDGHHGHVYNRDVVNVHERNVERTNVNVVNVNRRQVAHAPAKNNVHVVATTQTQQVKKGKKGHHDNDQDNNHH